MGRRSKKVAKLQRVGRGFWDSEPGQLDLNRVQRAKISVKELAKDLGVSPNAIYQALSKRGRGRVGGMRGSAGQSPALDLVMAASRLGEKISRNLEDLQERLETDALREELNKTREDLGVLGKLLTHVESELRGSSNRTSQGTPIR